MFGFSLSPNSKSALDGPPFILLIREKSKYRLRIAYVLMVVIWIFYTINRYNISTPVPLKTHIIFTLALAPSAFILLDSEIQILGEQMNWKILKVKRFYKYCLTFKSTYSNEIKIEARIVSSQTKSASLVIVDAINTIFSLVCTNSNLRRLLDECEIVDLSVKIRKRGKLNSIT